MKRHRSQWMVSFFVCGTPSDRGGFELVELGPSGLPGDARRYLDRSRLDEEQVQFEIERLPIGGSQFVRFARVSKINPYDSVADRGAYYAVGFITPDRIPLHIGSNCIACVAELAATVEGHIQPDRRFSDGFHFADLKSRLGVTAARLTHQCSPILMADLLQQALIGSGRFETDTRHLVFGPANYRVEEDAIQDLVYTGSQSQDALRSIDRDRERIQHLARTVTPVASSIADERAAVEDIRRWLGERAQKLGGIADELARIETAAIAAARVQGPLEPVARSSSGQQPSTKPIHVAASESRSAVRREGRQGEQRSRFAVRLGRGTRLAVGGLIAAVVIACAVYFAWDYFLAGSAVQSVPERPPAVPPVAEPEKAKPEDVLKELEEALNPPEKPNAQGTAEGMNSRPSPPDDSP